MTFGYFNCKHEDLLLVLNICVVSGQHIDVVLVVRMLKICCVWYQRNREVLCRILAILIWEDKESNIY